MVVVAVRVLTTNGEDAQIKLGGQPRGDIILGAQRVGCTQSHLRASGNERAHEVSGFGGDVQARSDALACKRLFILKTAAELLEGGHLGISPLDSQAALVRELWIGNIVAHESSLLFQHITVL